MSFSISLKQIQETVGSNVVDILTNVAGIPSEYCDEKHHPCILCGGVDRFRVIDMETGTCFCNQCFNSRNGDYVTAVMHFRNVTFRQALILIADHLGIRNDSAKNWKQKPVPISSKVPKVPKSSASISRTIRPLYKEDGSPLGMKMECVSKTKSWTMLFHWNGFTFQLRPEDIPQKSSIKKHTIYEYTDGFGDPHHLVYRMDMSNGRKIPMQFYWDGNAYVSGHGDLEIIPYNAPAVKERERVFFVEGEKCAAALQWDLAQDPPEGEMPAVTCINCGCGAFQDEYCAWFHGKDLLIFPDNDEPGRKFARELVEKLTPACKRVRVYKWPDGTPEKWDIADEIMKRRAEAKPG